MTLEVTDHGKSIFACNEAGLTLVVLYNLQNTSCGF